ncbi:MAG: hypothetical protein ACRD0U_07950 [Acidimicrobiales bacterium]
MRTWVAALGFVALLAACGGDDDEATTATEQNSTTTSESTTSSTTTSSTTTTTPPTPEDQAIAAYGRYWQVYYAAAAIPDPNHPPLVQAVTGGQLARIQDQLQRFVDQGLRGEAEVLKSSPSPAEVLSDRVVLTDCFLSRTVVLRGDTGEVVEPDDGVPRTLRVTVVNESGVWKVEDILNEETQCTPA